MGPLHEGRGRDGGREVLQGRGAQHRREDRLSGLWGRPDGRPQTPRRTMSTATAPIAAESRPPFRPGRIARAIAAFSGLPGYIIKLVLLALTNGVAVWAAYVLADRHHWVALPILIAATLAIDFFYLAPRTWTLPAK